MIKSEKIDDETYSIYDLLTREQCITLIKSQLPLNIRLFNKIGWKGKAVKRNKEIVVYFNFGYSSWGCFEYRFNTKVIKRILKI